VYARGFVCVGKKLNSLENVMVRQGLVWSDMARHGVNLRSMGRHVSFSPAARIALNDANKVSHAVLHTLGHLYDPPRLRVFFTLCYMHNLIAVRQKIFRRIYCVECQSGGNGRIWLQEGYTEGRTSCCMHFLQLANRVRYKVDFCQSSPQSVFSATWTQIPKCRKAPVIWNRMSRGKSTTLLSSKVHRLRRRRRLRRWAWHELWRMQIPIGHLPIRHEAPEHRIHEWKYEQPKPMHLSQNSGG
jgi:hypothetical protein